MFLKFPKNDKNFRWTQHIKDKMVYYGLSEQKLKTVLKNPKRKEEGIAEGTLAVMMRNDTPKRKQEIWLMYAVGSGEPTSKKLKVKSSMRVMISAWRYPGQSKPGKQLPISDELLEEIKKVWFEEEK
ncbi:MAG: Uncharacterized protein G01um101419_28 [Parcubacteria group bacterium Gr01-1014_19]|nr:MAG: Uncharacterized protein G01um101419_28 [Parcubacteria group bacterium Gr01-1014_19]